LVKIDSKTLFFTTSPRTPAKMVPEIRLLHERFGGREWSHATQTEFMNALGESDFFESTGYLKDKAFGARDRINRAPRALGFVDLKPRIALTSAGEALISNRHPQEVFLRQLLKFQLPSPYHAESRAIAGAFCVRPYLEIMRLIRELGYVTFDEMKIFALQLTDFRRFEEVKAAIESFRIEKEAHRGSYKQFVNSVWTNAVMGIYDRDIRRGRTRTRGAPNASIKKYITTKKCNMRDYADACFRYLRYTGLASMLHRSRTISFFPDKLPEVDHILSTVEREPVHIGDETAYKAHLFSATQPELYVDTLGNIVDTLMRVGIYTKRDLAGQTIDELKDLRDNIVRERRDAVIDAQVKEIKSYSLYSEITDTYNEIISKEILDAPLMLEYNTWRAMTMLDGGNVKGNFKFDDAGQPLSTAQGNVPDIECDYGNFVLSVEVTMQRGQRQYESEGEPIARHYGQMKKRTGKDAYCLFIAPTINPSVLAHFYALNQIDLDYYCGKPQIIPISLAQFKQLVDTAHNYQNTNHAQPTPHDVKKFLSSVVGQVPLAAKETEWGERIQDCIDNWLTA
jgi:hypothetical protein